MQVLGDSMNMVEKRAGTTTPRPLVTDLLLSSLCAPSVEDPGEAPGHRVARHIFSPGGDEAPELLVGRKRLLRAALCGSVRIEYRRLVGVGHSHRRGDRLPLPRLPVV